MSSFVALSRLARSFDDVDADDGTHPRREALLRVCMELGTTAIPLALRELTSPVIGRAIWAATLLRELADGDHRARVIADLSGLGTSTDLATNLLTELHDAEGDHISQ